MPNIITQISHLKRPRLLVRAAKAASGSYLREAHLTGDLAQFKGGNNVDLVQRLFIAEQEQNAQRKAQALTYSLPLHLNILIALIAEAQQLEPSLHAAKSQV